jgi:hypothetical protein
MGTTIIPPPGPVHRDVTLNGLSQQVHELHLHASGDLDKADSDDANYYSGLTDAYQTVQNLITGITVMKVKQATVRYAAGYPLLGDGKATVYMDARLTKAKEEDKIVNFHILDVLTGIHGIQYVTFTVDMKIPENLEYDDAKKFGEEHLNEIIHDTDVEIHFIGPVPIGTVD